MQVFTIRLIPDNFGSSVLSHDRTSSQEDRLPHAANAGILQ